MIVRLGYVAISMRLGKKITSSSTVTFANYKKIISENSKLEKLKSITLSNLNDLEKILKYNIDNNIHFYRITSALIPLVTHPEVGYWGHREIFRKDFEYLGKIINDHNMRVDTHPDQFNVLNSTNNEVVSSTIKNLVRQVEWFEDLNYSKGKMVLHVGGAAGGKEEGIKRFVNNFKTLPSEIASKLIIENDDKIYNTKDVLTLCNILDIPMVLDVHHHNCNNNGENVMDSIKEVFKTWSKEVLPPKIHFSTPRDFEKDKKHSDYINAKDFVEFLDQVKEEIDLDFDVMLECKQKDEALFLLTENIKNIRPEYKWIDNSTIEI